MSDLDMRGIFRWINGDVLHYDKWAVGEPTGTPESRCVTIRTRRLEDYTCDEDRPFLCSSLGIVSYS